MLQCFVRVTSTILNFMKPFLPPRSRYFAFFVSTQLQKNYILNENFLAGVYNNIYYTGAMHDFENVLILT